MSTARRVLDDTTLYATSFKKQTVAIDGPSGRPMWARDNGGPGRVGRRRPTAWWFPIRPARSGRSTRPPAASLWSQPALARRSLTAPTVQGDYAVVGDFDGYLHWLRLDNGEFAARERVGGDALRATPVVADGILLVQNIDGELSASACSNAVQ